MPRTLTVYSTEEISTLLGGDVLKQHVSRAAKRHGWQRVTGYSGVDVEAHIWPHLRHKLARKMGATVNELINHDDWDKDDNCPVCGAFAIYRPATDEEIKNSDLDVYGQDWTWLCINGHTN